MRDQRDYELYELIVGAEEPDGGPTLADLSTQWDELPATLDRGWSGSASSDGSSRDKPSPKRKRIRGATGAVRYSRAVKRLGSAVRGLPAHSPCKTESSVRTIPVPQAVLAGL